MSRPRVAPAFVVAALAAVLAGGTLELLGQAEAGLTLAVLAAVALLLRAVVLLLRRGLDRDSARRLPWLLLSTALILEVSSYAVTITMAARGEAATSNPETAVAWLHEFRHLIETPLVLAGLLLLPHGPQNRRRFWQTVFDTAAAAMSLVVIARQLLLPQQLVTVPAGELQDALIDIFWVVCVMTVIVYVVNRARTPGGLPLRSLVLLTGGVALWAVSDALGVLLPDAPATVASGLYLLLAVGAWLLIGGAATDRSLRPESPRALKSREYVAVLTPLIPLVGAGVVMSATLVGDSWLAELTVIAAFGAVLFLVAATAAARIDALVVTRTLESRVLQRTLALGTREKWFRALVQNSSDVVTVLSADGVIRYLTPSVAAILGHDPEALVGTRFAALLKPSDGRRLDEQLVEATHHAQRTYVVDFPIWHRNGSWVDTESSITSLIHDPDIRGLVLTTRDVSERRRLEKQLTSQAFSDSLTGLANRAMFRQRTEAALEHARKIPHGRGAGFVAVVFLDLDGFKSVNDSEGHATGDKLLELVSARISRCIRPEDLLARLGGDEFGVLVEGEGAESGAVWIAQRVRSALLSEFVIDGRPIRVGTSAGIAVNDLGHETADQLLRNADLAMYRAKSSRVASFVRFETQMHEALISRVRAEADLRQAVERGDLTMYYQPIVDLARDVVVGVEALVRWQHSTRGLVSPAEFIDLAEETGLIHDIGSWALVETARQGVLWQRFAPPGENFHVAVNVSAKQLNPSLPRSVRDALAASGLAPQALTLEMTESVLIEYDDEAAKLMRRLKQLGVRVAIDDFGTGYSSLSYLARFPVDVLKIDRSFIDRVGTDVTQEELARTIVQLGQSLRLVTVAEGIETSDQWHRLRGMGCRLGQGYLFARPMAPADLDVFLNRAQSLGSVSRVGAELSPTVEPVAG